LWPYVPLGTKRVSKVSKVIKLKILNLITAMPDLSQYYRIT